MGHFEPFGLERTRFFCMTCGAETTQEHFDLQGVRGAMAVALPASWAMTWCANCHTVMLFYDGDQVIPPHVPGQFDFDGLPAAIADEIRCALSTLHRSPRASAAHARCALYAMLTDVATRDEDAVRLPADQLFARLVPAARTSMHASFRDACLRGGALVPASVVQSQEPPGTASVLVDLLRQARSLLYPQMSAQVAI